MNGSSDIDQEYWGAERATYEDELDYFRTLTASPDSTEEDE